MLLWLNEHKSQQNCPKSRLPKRVDIILAPKRELNLESDVQEAPMGMKVRGPQAFSQLFYTRVGCFSKVIFCQTWLCLVSLLNIMEYVKWLKKGNLPQQVLPFVFSCLACALGKRSQLGNQSETCYHCLTIVCFAHLSVLKNLRKWRNVWGVFLFFFTLTKRKTWI